MTREQVLSLDGIFAENGAITNVELQNCNAGVVVKTNRHRLVGTTMGVRHFLIAGNGRVMDGRDFAFLFLPGG